MDKKTHSLCERVPRVVGSSRGTGDKNSTFSWDVGPTGLQEVTQRQFQPRQRMVNMQGRLKESGQESCFYTSLPPLRCRRVLRKLAWGDSVQGRGNDSSWQDLPLVWFPCFLVLFSSSVSHISQGCLDCGWEIMKFKGTNNKAAFAALSSLSGCGRKGVVCWLLVL